MPIAMFTRQFALLIIVLLCALPEASHAQDRMESTEDSELLIVQFDPPIGEPLAYIVTLEKKRSRGDRTLELEQELTFERIAEGFLLNLDVTAVSVDGIRLDLTDERIRDSIPPALRPFILSLQMELDPSGEPLRLRDWETKRKQLMQLPDLAIKDVTVEKRERVLAAANLAFGPLMSSSAEEAPGLIVRGWPTVLGYGGMELEDGAVYEAETLIDGGLLPNPIEADVELSMGKTELGVYRFLQTTTADTDALATAISTLMIQFEELASPPDGEGSGGNAEDVAEVAMIEELEIVFDSTSGMPLDAKIVRSTMLEGSTVSGDAITIRKILE